ncbi:uncharacterized protein LOC142817208 [Rhipicephalus microplus]|uniref:uncharacterized protein LOC142817208 n=1 Tax=Rhipicephalus microplus TaxID=6941 RepID=UPI003F6C86D2
MVYHAAEPATPEVPMQPGDFVVKRGGATTASPNKNYSTSSNRMASISPPDRGNIEIPNTSGSLVCILSNAPDGFPHGLCTHLIFKDISYDLTKNIIKATKSNDLLAFLSMARRSSATTAILVNAAESGLMDPSHRNAIKRFAQSLSTWLREHAVQGAALFSTLHADIRVYDNVVLTLWRHFQAQAPLKFQLIAGIYFEHFKSASSIQSLSRNSDLLLLLTHRTAQPDTCNVEYPLLFYFTKDDYKFMKSVCDKVHCSLCLSLNLAVSTSELVNNKFRFGDVCKQHTIEGYDQTCLSSAHVERDLGWDMPLRRNASHLQAFEDDASLTHRVTTFFNVHPTSCLAAFQADLEDVSGKCPGQPKYSRLLTLAKMVGRNTENLLVKSDSRGRSGSKVSTSEKRPFVCVFRKQHIYALFPKGLCTHLLYLSVTYDIYKEKLHEGKSHENSSQERNYDLLYHCAVLSLKKDLDMFLHLRGPEAAIVALESSLANILQAGKHEHMDPFLHIMSDFLQERHIDGIALISTLVTDMGNFANLAKRIWNHIESSHSVPKWQLVVGIQLQAINQSIVESLTGYCDILIFVNHPIIEFPSCKVSRPSNIPLTKHHLMIMQNIGKRPSRKPLPCMSVSLAVHDYRLRSSHESFMDDCVREKWVSYQQACPSKIGIVEKDKEWGAAYVKKNTTMLVFEDEKTITDKVSTFLEECPYGCVAAFHVEYEDFAGRCFAREKYSRLQSIANALQHAKVPSQEHYVPHVENDLPNLEGVCKKGGSKEECHKRTLVCLLSRKARNAVLVGQLCSHVVFTEAEFNIQSRTFSVPEQSFEEFLSYEGCKHLVALSPSVTSKQLFGSKQKKYILEGVRNFTSRHSKLDGMALFSAAQTQMELLVEFFTEVKADLHRHNIKKVLLAGLAPSHAAAYFSRLQGICEIIVLMTHQYAIPENCEISAPNPYFLTSNDILQMKMSAEPAGGTPTTTCVSINLAVRSFRIANKSEVGDACKRETWSNYAQVCPAKDTTFHNLGNTSVSWRNSTYMFTFENEGTLTKKVSHFLALHSEGCVLLFEADKDDIDGQCSAWEPAPRINVVSRLLFYVPMSKKETNHSAVSVEDETGPTESEGPKKRSGRVHKHFAKFATEGWFV